MKTSAKSLCIGCTTAVLIGGAAQAQIACSTYTIIDGDNLRSIASSAFGDSDLYRVIFDANRDVIGARADLILIGVSLEIPCDRETLAPLVESGAEMAVVDPAKQPLQVLPELPVEIVNNTVRIVEPAVKSGVIVAEVAPAPEEIAVVEVAAAEMTLPAAPTETVPSSDVPLRIVTGNGYLPFADEMLPGGGMFTQIVEMAVFRADPNQPYTMTFINDWQAHIDALLPMQAFDLSFPWVRPACETPEILSAGDLSRCENFAFSAPYYEIVEGYFAAANSDLLQVSDYAEFEGKRICRPEGLTTGVLDAEGLTMDRITLTRPLESSDCFTALAAGEVDLVSIDTAVGEATLNRMRMTGKFTQNPYLTRVLSLHVIAHKSNAKAVSMLKMLDEGALEMNQSGEWWDIVSTALERQ